MMPTNSPDSTSSRMKPSEEERTGADRSMSICPSSWSISRPSLEATVGSTSLDLHRRSMVGPGLWKILCVGWATTEIGS